MSGAQGLLGAGDALPRHEDVGSRKGECVPRRADRATRQRRNRIKILTRAPASPWAHVCSQGGAAPLQRRDTTEQRDVLDEVQSAWPEPLHTHAGLCFCAGRRSGLRQCCARCGRQGAQLPARGQRRGASRARREGANHTGAPAWRPAGPCSTRCQEACGAQRSSSAACRRTGGACGADRAGALERVRRVGYARSGGCQLRAQQGVVHHPLPGQRGHAAGARQAAAPLAAARRRQRRGGWCCCALTSRPGDEARARASGERCRCFRRRARCCVAVRGCVGGGAAGARCSVPARCAAPRLLAGASVR